MLRPLQLLVPLAAFAASAMAQTTHTVGPGGFAQIGAALAGAAAGDTIVVQPGNYSGFTVGVGVTIRALTSGTVFVQSPITVNCPFPQRAHLIGLDASEVSVQSAACTFDDCRVVPLPLYAGAVRADQAVLSFQDCVLGTPSSSQLSFGGTACGLFAAASVVSAVDTVFLGRARDIYYFPASPAVFLMSGSSLHASRCTLRGGDGVSTVPSSMAPALNAASSAVWLTDSTLSGGRPYDSPGSQPVACPVFATLGRLSRCTLQPANCPPAIATNGNGVGVHRTAPWRANTTSGVDVRGAANTIVGVFGSNDLDAFVVPLLEQPCQLGFATLVPITLLLTDGNGNASVAWAVPPGTAGSSLWLQLVADGNAPLQTSPVVGGIVRP